MWSKGARHGLKVLLAAAGVSSLLCVGLAQESPAARSTLREASGYFKQASPPNAAVGNVIPINLSQPSQFRLLPPLTAPLLEALKQASAGEKLRRLQIGLHRPLDEPLVVNAAKGFSANWQRTTN